MPEGVLAYPRGRVPVNKCIGIALPHGSRSIEYAGAHENLRTAMEYADKRGYRFEVCEPFSASVASNRNIAANTLLEKGVDWVFTCDDDMLYQEDIFIKMIERDKDIVSGLYVGRSAPYPIMAFNPDATKGGINQTIKYTDFTVGDVLKVVAVGGGCVFMKRGVLEKISSPWYCMPPTFWMDTMIWLHHRLGTKQPIGEIPPDVLPSFSDINPAAWDGQVAGEDVYFSLLAGAFGFEIYLDTNIQCLHIGDYKHSLNDNIAYERMMEIERERVLANVEKS